MPYAVIIAILIVCSVTPAQKAFGSVPEQYPVGGLHTYKQHQNHYNHRAIAEPNHSEPLAVERRLGSKIYASIAQEKGPDYSQQDNGQSGDLSAQDRIVGHAKPISWAGWASFLVSVFLLGVLMLTLKQTRRLANYSFELLNATHRAWIHVDPKITEYWYEGQSLEFSVEAEITNIGGSPALGVLTDMKIVPYDLDLIDDARNFAKSALTDYKEQFSLFLVPGESYMRPWGLTADFDQYEFEEIDPVIMICVTYRTVYSPDLRQMVIVRLVKKALDDHTGLPRDGSLKGDLILTRQPGGFAT